jgi:beta-glucosidase
VTINEPMVYVFMRYLEGVFPAPSRPGLAGGAEALRNMLHCHAAAYHTIKETYPAAPVGVAKNMAVLQARPGSGRLAQRWARWLGWFYNEMWLDSLLDGRFRFPLASSKISNLAGALDFVGINYYTRFYAKFPPIGGVISNTWEPGATISDGNYGEVYPAGIFQVIKKGLKYNKPIYITENGVPDAADRLRPSYLLTHLREIWRAISFNFPVMGYYHWSLTDNFEWDRGWTQRFGLIALDPETQTRTLRRSGELYRKICQQNQINSDMAAQYAPDLLKSMFPGTAPQAKTARAENDN